MSAARWLVVTGLLIGGRGEVAAQTLNTGSLRGTVVAADGGGLQAALIRVLDRHLTETTHADGSFFLPVVPVGPQRVAITAIGYQAFFTTITITPGDTIRLDVTLTPAVLRLEEIVTTGTISARARSEVVSPTSVVAGAALDRQLDATVAGSLRHEPGVAASGLGPATSQPVIRGLSGDRVVMLQDGIRPGDLASTSADHAVTVDPLTAQRIEVVRGPMSLLYGSSALGGVVNVIREDVPASRPDALHGAISAQASSVNRGAALGGYAVSSLGPLVVRGEGTLRGAGDTRTPKGRLINTDVRTIDLSGGASYIAPAGYAGVSYRYFDNEYGIPGGFVGGHPEGVDVAMQRHTIRSTFDLHPTSGSWESIRANIGGTFYRHTEYESSGAVGTRFRQSFLNGTVTARHRGLLGASSGAVGIGGHYRDIRTGGTLRTPATADYSLSAFAVQEYGDGPFRLQAGLRFDFAHYDPRERSVFQIEGEQVEAVSRSFGAFSGSVGAIYDLGSGLAIGGSIARAYRTPDFNELYSNGPHLAANSYDVGDPRLVEETGLGLDGFVRLDRSSVRLEIAAFRNQLDNYIFPSSRGRAVIGRQGGRPLFQFTNEAAVFQGFEGSFSLGLSRRVVFDATVSYVAAKFTSDRAPIPIISLDPPDTSFVAASGHPPLIPPLFGNAELRYERPQYFAGVGMRWTARQSRLGDFETETDGAVVGELHAGVRLLIGGQFHTLTLRVDNLTNAEYYDHLSRIKEIEPQPGRNISLLYRFTF